MNKIRITLTREENKKYGSTIEVDFEDYIFCVVASEIGNAPIEACKAQAVAARTIALPYLNQNKAISDVSVQAFRISRMDKSSYPNAHQGALKTAYTVLCYEGKAVSPCAYSASNGGRTTASEDRWGGRRAYLIEQDDPYDYAVTKGKKTGHGVGMSQEGAKEMARRGFSYEEILSFYYHGAV